ncbi:hypothetical protein ACSBR2_024081 [Camellia fascicularis]
MKSIAAVAISESPHFTISQIVAAGISTASVLLLLGSTGLMSFFYRFIRPLPLPSPPPPPTVPNKPILTQLCELYYKEERERERESNIPVLCISNTVPSVEC